MEQIKDIVTMHSTLLAIIIIIIIMNYNIVL